MRWLTDFVGLVIAGLARLATGAQGHGGRPKAEQRVVFARHQSHPDGVLIRAVLPRDLRAATRRASAGCCTGSPPSRPARRWPWR